MKKLRTAVLAAALAGALTLGAAAAGAARITADLRPDITVEVNGVRQNMTDKNGDAVYAISYNGTTYLPVRALGESLGHTVSWDSATQTVRLTPEDREESPAVTTLDQAEDRMAELEADVRNLKPGSTYAERARQYAALSAKLDAFREDVNDLAEAVNEDLRQGKITYAQYNERSGRIGAVDVRLKDTQALLEEKTIANDSGYQTAYERRAAALKELEGQVASAVKKVAGLTPADTYAGRTEQYEAHADALNGLRGDVNGFYDGLNDDLREMRVTYDQYNTLSARAGKADVSLKDALVDLQEKLFSTATQSAYEAADADLRRLESDVQSMARKIDALKSAATHAERLRQYNTCAPDISALSGRVNKLSSAINEDLRQGRLSYGEYNALSRRAGALDVELKDVRSALEAKTVSWDGGAGKPDQGDGTTYGQYTAKLDDLERRIDRQVAAVEQYRPARGDRNNKQAWRQMEEELDALDDELDALDAAAERDYRKGNLTAAEYRALEQRMDDLDDRLERAEDRLDDFDDD